MRAGIGLLSLLLVAGIVFYLSFGGKNGGYEGHVLTEGRTAGNEAAQFSGQEHPEDSIVLTDDLAGNELRGLKVTAVTPGGLMERTYGIAVDDIIIQANQLDVRGQESSMAKAMVAEGFARNQNLVVKRGPTELTLKPMNTALSKTRPDLFPKSVPTH
jgi:hypothetical protein